jgi:hypothetical protein
MNNTSSHRFSPRRDPAGAEIDEKKHCDESTSHTHTHSQPSIIHVKDVKSFYHMQLTRFGQNDRQSSLTEVPLRERATHFNPINHTEQVQAS